MGKPSRRSAASYRGSFPFALVGYCLLRFALFGGPGPQPPFQIGTRAPQAIDLTAESAGGRRLVLEFALLAPYIALPGAGRARA